VTAAERSSLANFLEALSEAVMTAPPERLPRYAGYCEHLASVARDDRDVLRALQTAEALLRKRVASLSADT
jgi:hypothetical protein